MRKDFDAPDFPHGITGYGYGCRCGVCRAANAKKNRDARARRKAERQKAFEVLEKTAKKKKPANVVQFPSAAKQSKPRRPSDHNDHVNFRIESDDSVAHPANNAWKPRPLDEIGRVEKAVIDQCAEIEEAVALSAMVMNARAVARVLDDPRQISQHASASRQLQAILVELTGGAKGQKDKRKTGARADRLGVIAGMTKVRRAQ